MAFFFKRLKINNTGRYTQEFPYVSLCGPERNFVRCDDLPIVFTKIIQKENLEIDKKEDWFGYSHAEEFLMVNDTNQIYVYSHLRITVILLIFIGTI